MIARGPRARSGITLTEILIAILIMGVGLISLATLFPLGLIRLREATRYSRSGLAFESAADDVDARSLLYKPTFQRTWYGFRDPFVQDALPNGTYNAANAANAGVIAAGNTFLTNNNVGLSSGLPFAYDPLWRSLTGVYPGAALADSGRLDFAPAYVSAASPNEARFGAGVFAGSAPFIRNDPNDTVNTLPSAIGLQRLTNFIPWSPLLLTPRYPFTTNNFSLASAAQPSDVAGDAFTSIDDIIFNPVDNKANAPSSVLPDMSAGTPQADYRFTWFITGRQVDAGGNGSQFSGEIVVCDGRPFGFDPLPGAGVNAPTGETVVEAIYGVAGTNSAIPIAAGSSYGFGASDRSVLLRWPVTMPDPTVKTGGWICDPTYERDAPTYVRRLKQGLTSMARCNWYQVVKRGDPVTESATSSAPAAAGSYRRMVLTLGSPLKAKTLLLVSDGSPVHVNVALVMPSVINVFPRSFVVH